MEEFERLVAESFQADLYPADAESASAGDETASSQSSGQSSTPSPDSVSDGGNRDDDPPATDECLEVHAASGVARRLGEDEPSS